MEGLGIKFSTRELPFVPFLGSKKSPVVQSSEWIHPQVMHALIKAATK